MNLRVLVLSKFMIKADYNNIESIEELQFMSMPLLKHLSLSKAFDKSDGNYITNLSALNKCAWNSLRGLGLRSYLIYSQFRTKCKNSILQDWEWA